MPRRGVESKPGHDLPANCQAIVADANLVKRRDGEMAVLEIPCADGTHGAPPPPPHHHTTTVDRWLAARYAITHAQFRNCPEAGSSWPFTRDSLSLSLSSLSLFSLRLLLCLPDLDPQPLNSVFTPHPPNERFDRCATAALISRPRATDRARRRLVLPSAEHRRALVRSGHMNTHVIIYHYHNGPATKTMMAVS